MMIHPLLAGNGPKEIDIREVIEREGTEDRVALGKKIFSPLKSSLLSLRFQKVLLIMTKCAIFSIVVIFFSIHH